MTKPVPGHEAVGTEYGVPGSWASGYHMGRDYPAPAGATVVATRKGSVAKAQYDGDYGNRIELMTDGVEHAYCHLSKFSVKVGDIVSEGQKIGEVGSTGRSTGPHLHYEERVNPYGYNDDRKPLFDTGGGGTTPPPPSGDQWASGDVYQNKLFPGSMDSDSVRRLQRVLNEWSFVGGVELPITGNYLEMTEAEVAKFQEQICGDPGDGAIGPKQTDKLFVKLGPWNIIR